MTYLKKLCELPFLFTKRKTSDELLLKKNKIYYNDEVFNKIEFCPRENYDFLLAENHRVAQNSMQNYDIFSVLCMHDDIPVKILDKKISYKIVNDILIKNKLNRIERVYENYGRSNNKCNDTIAYVDSEKKDIAIFMIVKEHLVRYLWLHRFNLQGSVQKIGLLKQMLLEIGTICNFILNDWELGIVVDLTSGKQIEDYLLTE